jgi:hypothetical protein
LDIFRAIFRERSGDFWICGLGTPAQRQRSLSGKTTPSGERQYVVLTHTCIAILFCISQADAFWFSLCPRITLHYMTGTVRDNPFLEIFGHLAALYIRLESSGSAEAVLLPDTKNPRRHVLYEIIRRFYTPYLYGFPLYITSAAQPEPLLCILCASDIRSHYAGVIIS